MRNVLQRRERCVRESLSDARGHVRTGNRVEHSPDEGQPYIGRLEYLGPALGVLAAVLDVADQEMRVLLPLCRWKLCQIPAASAAESYPSGNVGARPAMNNSRFIAALICGPCSGSSRATCAGWGRCRSG